MNKPTTVELFIVTCTPVTKIIYTTWRMCLCQYINGCPMVPREDCVLFLLSLSDISSATLIATNVEERVFVVAGFPWDFTDFVISLRLFSSVV